MTTRADWTEWYHRELCRITGLRADQIDVAINEGGECFVEMRKIASPEIRQMYIDCAFEVGGKAK